MSELILNLLWDHVPAASTTPSDESYLDCSCGWEQDDKTGWMEHMGAALVTLAPTPPVPLEYGGALYNAPTPPDAPNVRGDTRPCTEGPDGGTCDGSDHVRHLVWSCFTATEMGRHRDAYAKATVDRIAATLAPTPPDAPCDLTCGHKGEHWLADTEPHQPRGNPWYSALAQPKETDHE